MRRPAPPAPRPRRAGRGPAGCDARPRPRLVPGAGADPTGEARAAHARQRAHPPHHERPVSDPLPPSSQGPPLGFPLRGYRWAFLLRRTGMSIRVRDSTEIIFISWLVNCLVPAKLGDVYRACPLRLNYAPSLNLAISAFSKNRFFDLFAIAI